MKKYRKIILTCFFLLCFAGLVLLAGCRSEDRFGPVTAKVLQDDQFGDVLIDLQELELAYGDSVDLAFSGGYSIESIPYYPDFYGTKGQTILTDFYDDLAVAGIGCSFNETAKIKEGETVTITLDERGKYKKEYEAYHVDPDIEKWEGQTDEAFRNAREVTAGDIAEGVLYRGSSPFDSLFCRVELMGEFIQEKQIQTVLDLSDKKETLDSTDGLPENTAEMIKNGRVITALLEALCGLPEADLQSAAADYFIRCGMTADQVDRLKALLCAAK